MRNIRELSFVSETIDGISLWPVKEDVPIDDGKAISIGEGRAEELARFIGDTKNVAILMRVIDAINASEDPKSGIALGFYYSVARMAATC